MDNHSKENVSSLLKPGTTLRGIYIIEKQISSGGFGNTYLAKNTEFDEHVAIKEFFMKDRMERDATSSSVSVSDAKESEVVNEQKEKFKKEARRIRKLRNKHIVGVYDIFEENETVYYVMDYIDGESLSDRMKRTSKTFTEQEVWNILPQVLDALKTIHDTGLWHLDLKPNNIMLDKYGQIKLIDFGASKQFNVQNDGITRTAITRTEGYAPREQMEGMYTKLGPWTDIFSLGATLYRILTNKHIPSSIDIDDDDSLDKHESLPFPEGISKKLRNLIIWMMNTNRSKRPQSVREIEKYINANGETISINTGSPKPIKNNDNLGDDTTIINKGSKDSEETKFDPYTPRPTNKKNDDKSIRNVIIALSVFGGMMIGGLCFKGCGGKTPYTEAIDTVDTVAVDTIVNDTAYYDDEYFAADTCPVGYGSDNDSYDR